MSLRLGICNPSTPSNFKLEDVHAVLNRNLIGTMLMCRAITPGMAARQHGSVVNIGSLHAHLGTPVEIGYACAKAAIVHYTRCLALELRLQGVRANAVSPGPAKTARVKFAVAEEEAPESRTTDAASLSPGLQVPLKISAEVTVRPPPMSRPPPPSRKSTVMAVAGPLRVINRKYMT